MQKFFPASVLSKRKTDNLISLSRDELITLVHNLQSGLCLSREDESDATMMTKGQLVKLVRTLKAGAKEIEQTIRREFNPNGNRKRQ